jgi:hypothetical protein
MRLTARRVVALSAGLGVLAATACANAGASAPMMLGSEVKPQRSSALDAASTLAPAVTSADPAPEATPPPECGPGSRPAPGIDGRVVGGEASAAGYTCNMVALGHEGKAGGYKVERYVDAAGHECAYYDTTLLFPLNAFTLSSQPTGTAVLDVSNPAKPVRTATLLTPAMQSPHESLLLNQKRGLLAAVMGTPVTAPGFIDIYDLEPDCRHPALQSSLPVGLLGHESGWSPDGKTFYATSIGTGQITAVDVTDPRLPVIVWVGNYASHGLTISDDGNRAYVALRKVGLLILDVSEIQARKPNPQVREVSRLTWKDVTIPQVALPVTIGGKPFLVEVDEFSFDDSGSGRAASNGATVGAARIIDISDETAPRVVSNLRLAVNQPENRAAVANDPGASSSLQGYASHYCSVPRENDPGIVACSFIASGLRVFDIRDPYQPRQIAYFVAPPGSQAGTGAPGDKSDWAMSKPAFAPARDEIWYSDGNSGFYSLKVTNGAWPR